MSRAAPAGPSLPALSHCSDISPLLKDPVAFRTLIDLLEDHLRASFPKIDFIAGECWLNTPGARAERCVPGGKCGVTLLECCSPWARKSPEHWPLPCGNTGAVYTLNLLL